MNPGRSLLGDPAVEPLLSPSLMARLERLELVSRKMFRGRMKGERQSRRKGQSVEFADFRNYVPGDDLRQIDWNLYARLDQLFLKLFQEEEDLHVHGLVDGSASMRFGNPSKFRVACQTAASLGYVGLCRGDRVRVAVMGSEASRAPVIRGRRGVGRLSEYLDSVDRGGADHNLSLVTGVRDFVSRHGRAGVVILLTDLLDKSGYDAAIRLLVSRRMDVIVMHLIAPEEIDPPTEGDRRLIDVEDHEAIELTLTPLVRERYRQRVRAFSDRAKTFCSARGAVYIPVRTEVPVEEIVTKYLRHRGVVR